MLSFETTTGFVLPFITLGNFYNPKKHQLQ